MSCYHPLKGFPIGKTENGKTKYKITSFNVDHLDIDIKTNKIYTSREPFYRGMQPTDLKPVLDFVQIPCGQCLGCRLDYAQQWATRCMLELESHKSSYFVTLTYNDFHLPIGKKGNYSLSKRDYQLFMKRLRKNFRRVVTDEFGAPVLDEDGNEILIPIRFYACGEYGGQTMRPHYHAILFGLELDDLVYYKTNPLGQKMYTSEKLQRCWSDFYGEIGFVVIAEVSWESCAYVSRYVMKKQKGQSKSVYDDVGIEPEFCLMSRKPGLAREYFDCHPDIYEFDQINISTLKGGKKVKPPRYYDYLFDIVNPDKMKEVKQNRKDVAEAITASKLAQTSLSYTEMLASEESARKQKIKVLEKKTL